MARPGWSAKGLLKPLWQQYPGGRDKLAEQVGTTGSSLSGRNTGKVHLGHDLAERLAAELTRGLGRPVSVLELGAPEDVADEHGQTLLDLLDELTTKLADSETLQVRQERHLRDLRRRVRALEARHESSEDEREDPPTAGRPQ